jgi:hypothetical protein
MYKNSTELMTCSSCHDPHQRTANLHQLKADPTDNDAACGGSCHTSQVSDLTAHLTAKSIPFASGKALDALCIDCHMTKAAKTGAGRPRKVLQGVQYWENDVTSHLFKVPARSNASSGMPVPYTNLCGLCHTAAP